MNNAATDFTLRRLEEISLNKMVNLTNSDYCTDFLINKLPHVITGKDENKPLKPKGKALDIFGIDLDGKVIGTIVILPQSDLHSKNAEISYWLDEPYWGQEIMTRVIRQIVAYGFETYDITRIFACPLPVDPAAIHALEKAGFVCEARIKNALFIDGEIMDELIYGIRNDD